MADGRTYGGRGSASDRCVRCLADLPKQAAYCPVCGAPQSEIQVLVEECEITLWRGYVSGEFVAVWFDGSRYLELARSPSFRWLRGRTVPRETKRLVARIEAIAEELEEKGWERDGQGRAWYARRFRREIVDESAAAARVSAVAR
jgi:hypothetical protein